MREVGLEQYINWEVFAEQQKNAQWRQIIQQQLSNAIWKASGARYMTLFFVKPLGNSSWSYWLVHLSNKFRARDVMMGLHWQYGNSFGHSLDPGLYKIGYEASEDEGVTGQSSLDIGETHAFDTVLRNQCVNTLSEVLPRVIYEKPNGQLFGDLMHSIANNTTATSDLVREALDISVKTGDIEVRSAGGASRMKGASIGATDIIVPGQQKPLFLLN